MGDQVLFINTGGYIQTGWMVAIGRASYAVIDVLRVDGGVNRMGWDKCSVQSLNGKLYFHLIKNNNTGILSTLSSTLITVANYSHTKTENLTSTSATPLVTFTSTNYPLSSNS